MWRLAALAALAALLVAGCGGSSRPKGPPALVFISTRDGDYAIYGSDARGRHQYRLTKDKGNPATPAGLFFQFDPAWSPDGTKIAFGSHREGTSHIYVMRWDGTGTRRLTDSSQNDGRPSWSPDGKWIVFAREGAIFRIPAAGGRARRIPTGPGSAEDPAYSPDGKLVAYDYRTPGTEIREVYVTRLDGTGRHQVTHLGQLSGRPVWSPDGKRLAFQSNAYEGHYEIYTVRPDGTGFKRVTFSSTDTFQPDWGRGGAIAFSRGGAIWFERGGNETKLTSDRNNDSAPAWRPGQPQ